MVDQMADAYVRADKLVLAVAPDGTRRGDGSWKSGFYRIAIRAEVPLLISILDYGGRTISLGGLFQPTGDYAADLPFIRKYYEGAAGRIPSRTQPGDDDT